MLPLRPGREITSAMATEPLQQQSGGCQQPARRWSVWDSLSLLLFTATVALELVWHKPWADEAQSWLLARSMSFWQLLTHGVRYEGSPALWHCFLHLLILLHVSYATMPWIAGATAVGGIAIFLRWSPFPTLLRVLLPLTFWLAYQDAVIDRSYVLFTLLGFAAAALLRAQARRPILLAVILALCANLSLHGFIAALAMGWVAVVLEHRRRKSPTAQPGIDQCWTRKQTLTAVLIFFAGLSLATYSALPPADSSSPTSENLVHSLDKIEAQFKTHILKVRALNAHSLSARAPQLAVAPHSVLTLTPAPNPRHPHTPWQSLREKTARILGAITFTLSSVALFGLVLFGVLLWLARRSEQTRLQSSFAEPAPPMGWIGLAPYGLLLAVFSLMYLAPRHCGMLMTGFVISLWLVWPEASSSGARRITPRGMRIATALLLLMAAEQIGWTAHALWANAHIPSSPGAATAKLLAAYPQARVAGFYYHAVNVQPYFAHNRYLNWHTAYWLWSTHQQSNANAPAAIAEHPQFLVVSGWSWSPINSSVAYDWHRPEASLNTLWMQDRYHIAAYAEAHGYHVTHIFCGEQFMRWSYSERACNLVLEPAAQ